MSNSFFSRHQKFGDYLLEIFVIIIGILGAFLLDSWNDARIDRNTEMEILEEIQSNLIEDFEDMNQNIANLEKVQYSSKVLIDFVIKDQPYHDSLGYHFFNMEIYPHFTTNLSGYTLLKSKGLDLISDNDLRQAITQLYEYHYVYLMTWEEEMRFLTQQSFEKRKFTYRGVEPIAVDAYPQSSKKFWNYQRYVDGQIAKKMINIPQFKKDTELHSVIDEIGTKVTFLKPFHERTKREAENVVTLIKKILNLHK